MWTPPINEGAELTQGALYSLAIYAPMIYTALYVMFLMREEGKWEEVGPW